MKKVERENEKFNNLSKKNEFFENLLTVHNHNGSDFQVLTNKHKYVNYCSHDL